MSDVFIVYATNFFTFLVLILGVATGYYSVVRHKEMEITFKGSLLFATFTVSIASFMGFGAQYLLALYDPEVCSSTNMFCGYDYRAREYLMNYKSLYGYLSLAGLSLCLGVTFFLLKKLNSLITIPARFHS